MNNTAIIGSYASDKLLILGYDVQRTHERTLQQTKNKKVVGDSRQNIKITLDGRLEGSTFSELENEIQLLLEALNKKVINLVIGATPDRFYRVSYSGVGLPRRAGTGGPNLPFSLDFDCIDDGAFVGLPVTYGGASLPGVPFLVSNLGKPVGEVTLLEHKTFFSQGRKLWNAATGEGLKVSGGTATLTLGGVVTSWKVPEKPSYNLGLVFHPNKIVSYIDGRSYVTHRTYDTYIWIFDTGETASFGAFGFPATDAYMAYVARNPSIIQGKKLEGQSISFRYNGADKTPASIYAISGQDNNGITLGDFGARYKTPGWFNFNTIEGEVTSNSDMDSLSYNGRFTFLPRLKKGMNTLTRTAGNNDVYLFWREMVR